MSSQSGSSFLLIDRHLLCRTVTGSITCIKGFMKKCGTPIQRELFDFMMEQFVESVNLFCNTPDTRKGMTSSP